MLDHQWIIIHERFVKEADILAVNDNAPRDNLAPLRRDPAGDIESGLLSGLLSFF